MNKKKKLNSYKKRWSASFLGMNTNKTISELIYNPNKNKYIKPTSK